MANNDEILLHTGLLPGQVAEVLAGLPGTRLIRHPNGDCSVVCRAAPPDEDLEVGGGVLANHEFHPPGPAEDDSIYESYDTSFTIWSAPRRSEAVMAATTAWFFAEIIATTDWPAVRTTESGLLIAAWSPALGLTNFPPGTTCDEDDRAAWAPYARPALPG